MKHPYKKFENSSNWKILKESIEELISNNDIEILTPIEYIIGYLCKALQQNNKEEKNNKTK